MILIKLNMVQQVVIWKEKHLYVQAEREATKVSEESH